MLFLAPTCEKRPVTRALHNNAPEHTNSHQIYNQTNNLTVDTGPNLHVLSQKMPTPSLPAMTDGKLTKTPSPHPGNTGMPTVPYEDPLIGTPETPNQEATQRSTSIAFLGNWKRGYDVKIVIATVLANKAHNHRHTAFKKWKHYTRLKTTTVNLTARTVRTSLTEVLRQWRRLLNTKNERHNTKKLVRTLTVRLDTHNKAIMFNNWWKHTHDSSADPYPHVQLFLKGLASETLTITVPFPVARQQLHEIIAKKTLIPHRNSA